MKRFILPLLCLGGMLLPKATGAAQLLPYDELPLKYPTLVNWDASLKKQYAGWKASFLQGGNVQGKDPSGNAAVVSEGQSYGMMMALWFNDQATFNAIWSATETNMWNGSTYGWKSSDKNSWAADADLDIAGMLIFASALVDKGLWTDYTVSGNNYKAKALKNLDGIAKNMISGGMVKSGNWTGAMNPSYQEVHWYRVFSEFLKANGASDPGWSTTIYNGGYQLLGAQPNGNKGMARNFCTSSGGSQGDGVSMPTRDDMGFDAIRVPWRVGLDGLWYRAPKAFAWIKGAWTGGIVDPAKPGLYVNLSSPRLWGWCEPAEAAAGTCTSEYEQFMSRIMWAASAIGGYDSIPAAKTAYMGMVSNIASIIGGRSYFSYYDDNATSKPSQNYFAQSLGILGALAMAGRAVNVWDDLKNPWNPPDTAAKITTALKASVPAIYLAGQGSPESVTFTATFSRPAICTLYVTGATSGAKYKYVSATASTSLSVPWTASQTQAFTSKKFIGGENVDVTIKLSGSLSVPANGKVTIQVKGVSGVQRASRLSRAQWIGSDVVLPQGILSSASQAQVRVLDLRGHVVAQATSLVREEEGVARIAVPRPQGLSGVYTLEIASADRTWRGPLSSF